jgi:hypothetical protein
MRLTGSYLVFTKSWARRVSRHFLPFVALALVCVTSVSYSLKNLPMSVVDEHVHYDYLVKLSKGQLPVRGSIYEDEVLAEWTCGVGHEAGSPFSCGDSALSVEGFPSGKYSTAYIHYPTYFFLSTKFASLLTTFGLHVNFISSHRIFAALLFVLASILMLIAGWASPSTLLRTGLVVIPVAASGVFLFGTIINPASSALVCGSLVALSALRWSRSDSGWAFLALLISSWIATLTAVTNSWPVVAVLLAGLVYRWRTRNASSMTKTWNPGWAHLGLLAGTLLVPPTVWRQYIESSATQTNEELHAFAAVKDVWSLIAGIARELFSIHNPWYENDQFSSADLGPLQLVLRSASAGATTWIGVGIFGMIFLIACRATRHYPNSNSITCSIDPNVWSYSEVVRAFSLGIFFVLVGYAPFLRASNAANFGIDFGIVSRYGISLIPLLLLLIDRSNHFVNALKILSVLALLIVGGFAATLL